MDTALQFRSSIMGLAFYLLNYRADSYLLFHVCQDPNPRPGLNAKVGRPHIFSGGRFMGWVWKRRPWGIGPLSGHCSDNPVSPSCLKVPGLTLETQFGLPVCPAEGSQAYILSHHPTPTSPGPQAPASWRVMAVCMST